ncbi:MAG: aminomethyl-transferring glycine dehydrogenase subunit GcvPA [Clostridiales Family XIII bacterium]|jgi:glycine dehydrogenase subunit 1|nr:aminomethyl-transferring glycine dehydrogenase subunit GcvPA [Clostridiales Family XIII bacterium]
MAHYLPSTDVQRAEMLGAIGRGSIDELYAAVPQLLLQESGPNIPAGLSELEVTRKMSRLAEKNTVFRASFRGAGAYRHYRPAIVDAVTSKETFVTAYTPYQAELSQGILQSIFEYQTMIAELMGLDSSNASVYDGATATAEAAAMCRDRKRGVTLISETAHPEVIETVKTYCWAANNEVRVIPAKDGLTDLDELRKNMSEDVSGVYLMQPNYFGLIEDCEAAAEIIHEGGAKCIMGVNPIAAAILRSPGECGADIAVGEGQPLGMPLSFGGPYLGFMAATGAMTRKLPGRIVGQTTDDTGRRAFVLTLQAREQHIRREKAGSNICSNQALCAMTAAVYLAAMGPRGLKEVAAQCFSKAHYLARELEACGFKRRHDAEFFHEFLTECPVDTAKLEEHLARHGILAGAFTHGGILWCATEMNTKEEIDRLITLIKEVA